MKRSATNFAVLRDRQPGYRLPGRWPPTKPGAVGTNLTSGAAAPTSPGEWSGRNQVDQDPRTIQLRHPADAVVVSVEDFADKLTVILGHCELAMRWPQTREAATYLSIIREAGKDLARLLDTSMGEAGLRRSAFQPVPAIVDSPRDEAGMRLPVSSC